MTEHTDLDKEVPSEDHTAEARQETSFHYQMVDMKARKITTLIKFSKLPYLLEEVTEIESKPYLLRTTQGELYDEYEIIAYIVNDSFLRSIGQEDEKERGEEKPLLWGVDIFNWAKMNQHLVQLRKTLFPLLEEFYRYLLGHQRVRRSRYQALGNKIRKQILKLDQIMGQHSQIYGVDFCYLNIIIVCQLFLACKFVFEEKFRKSKIKLFSKCQKISRTSEFQEIYGKASFCVRECLPAEFDQEEETETKKEEAIQMEIAKLVQPWVCPSGNEKRNELLYNFFRNTLKGQESKSSYFPYLWLMYDHLLCNLVELHFDPSEHGDTYPELEKSLMLGTQELGKVLKLNLDYGFLGIYFNQKDRQYILQGLVCLGDLSFEEFSEEMGKHNGLKRFKPSKVDINSEEEKKKVEMLWEFQAQGMTFEGIKVSLIRQF